MESPSCKNSALVAGLADAAEEICAAEGLAAIAAAAMHSLSRLLACSAVSFSAFDLRTLDLVLDEHRGPDGMDHGAPRLERSRNLAACLEAGAQLLTLTGNGEREYFVLYENRPAGLCRECELRLPFFRDPDTLCVISLGKKESGMDYSSDEIDVLRVLIALMGASSPSPAAVGEPCAGLPDELASYQRRGSCACLLGSSPQLLGIKEKIACIAPTDASVLVTGESGTGKELVARAIHQQSRRCGRDMVVVNCAALPEQLAESELFGHERGAFTGALTMKKGKFEFADLSSLFLDEIGDLSPAVQAKLLRFLQDGVFQRVGGSQNLRSRIRLISATNRDLLSAIADGAFRQDLYYRINVVQIELPPLREHPEDIPLLAEYYARQFAGKYRLAHQRLHPDIDDWLRSYSFPGNVRELINIVERMVILGNGPAAIATLPCIGAVASPDSPRHLPQSLEILEREHIQAILKETGCNKSAAARILGIARKTLREKMVKYHLQ
ncbi:MAG TPA: sigma-54 dependent transcriptional regulator [bacterium]|nr:sigma-54 dependent transcriptional regulator [bacterium]